MTVTFNQDGFAETSGEIIVYCTDNQGIYSHSITEYVSEGGSLSAGSYLDAPPPAKQGFVIVRADNSWQYQADHRGTYYSKETGEKVEHTALGELPENLTALAPLAEPCKWNGTAWVKDEAKIAEIKSQQQAEMWECIKQKRHDNLRGGVFVRSIGKWFHSNDESRQQYTFMRTLEQLPPNMQWKTMENAFVPFNKAILDELSLQLIADEQADFANAERHKHLMEQVENPLNYDFSDGWTTTFTE